MPLIIIDRDELSRCKKDGPLTRGDIATMFVFFFNSSIIGAQPDKS
jgi:hypothetical protein